MRILLLNQFYYPDIAATAQLCTDWAEDLTRLGHDVTVLCGSGRYRQPHLGRMAEPTRTLPLDEVHHGVRIVRVPVEDAPPPVSALPTRIEQLGRLVGRLSGYGQFVVRALLRLRGLPRPDVVVALTTPPLVGVLGLLASRMFAARLVLWVQDVYPDLLDAMGLLRAGSPAYRSLDLLARQLYRSADRIVALDEAMADRLLKAGARSSQLAIIDHFADSREITLRPKLPSGLRAELGLHDEFVVCYAGNHGRGHDFDTIVQALEAQAQAQADLTVPPLHWLFVGDGDEKARLWARIPSKMQPYVHALPPQARSKLGEVLAAGDVGLISVKAEMQGLLAPSKLYGLLAAGRPLAYIGPECGRIPALLRQYDLGVAVRNGDGAVLFAGLVAIQQDPARWQSMSQLARQLAETRFDRPLAMAAHARVLESVLREGSCEQSG